MTQNTTIAVNIIHETERGLLVDAGFGETWLPKSQITWSTDTVTLPEWLAKKSGLI